MSTAFTDRLNITFLIDFVVGDTAVFDGHIVVIGDSVVRQISGDFRVFDFSGIEAAVFFVGEAAGNIEFVPNGYAGIGVSASFFNLEPFSFFIAAVN